MRLIVKAFSTAIYILSRLIKKARPSAVRDCQIHKSSAIEAGSQIVDTTMGRHSFCGYDCTLLNCDIGNFCSIADNVYIGGSQHPMHFVSTSPAFLSHRDSIKTKFSRHEYSNMPRTFVGHDVWIGHGAKIRAGVSVGHGAVIGMGAVVSKDVRPYAIIVGNPGREIRRRFDDKTCEALLASKWWEKGDPYLYKYASLFNEPKRFLGEVGRKNEN